MKMPEGLKYALAAHSVTLDRESPHVLSSDITQLITETRLWSGAENDGVAVSYFFRQYSLFISAQFDLLTNYNGYFSCSWQDLRFERVHNYGYNLLQTVADSDSFITIKPEDRFHAMHFILHRQVDEFIQAFRHHVKISPNILWDNILGSVVWFYASLEKRDLRRTAEDLEWLLNAENWKPIRTSYMKKLMGDASLERAISGPLRKTCCLYKELPHYSTCTFCPFPK